MCSDPLHFRHPPSQSFSSNGAQSSHCASLSVKGALREATIGMPMVRSNHKRVESSSSLDPRAAMRSLDCRVEKDRQLRTIRSGNRVG